MIYLISGMTFGLSAGLSPGPLLTLVISETLRHGLKEGIKVSLAPLITDAPIIVFVLLILSRLSDTQFALGLISAGGALLLAYLGCESLRFREKGDVPLSVLSLPFSVRPKSIRKGVIANLLNPGPYLFWLMIGGPTVLRGSREGIAPAVLFVISFYLLLVGSKMGVALLVERSRRFLKSTTYIYVQRILGLVLFGFSIRFARDALVYFNLLQA